LDTIKKGTFMHVGEINIQTPGLNALSEEQLTSIAVFIPLMMMELFQGIVCMSSGTREEACTPTLRMLRSQSWMIIASFIRHIPMSKKKFDRISRNSEAS
jgi:hypothetical protein